MYMQPLMYRFQMHQLHPRRRIPNSHPWSSWWRLRSRWQTADITAEESKSNSGNGVETDTSSQGVTASSSESSSQGTVGQEKTSESAVSSSSSQNTETVGSAGSGTGDAAEGGNSLISNVTQNEDGTVTVTDKLGGKSTINQETGEINVDVSESKSNYIYKEEDAADTPEGAEYLGTEESTGIAMYRKIQNEVEYWAESQTAEDELEQLEEYAQMETLSGDDLASAMAAASSWDAQVLEERYDAVYDENAVMTADLLDDEEEIEEENQESEEGTEEEREEVQENTAEPIGYVLKEEYQDVEPTYTDKISFSSVSTAAAFGSEDIAVASEDGEIAENTDTGDDTWVSTTVCFVSDGSLAIRVTDESGVGINNASVTVTIDQDDPITMTTGSMTDGSTVGDGVVIINNISGTHSAFINISAQGYRGVTRVAQEIKGGDVLTFSLQEAKEGEVYLRGVSIDGADCYDANFDLYVSKKNLSTYNITAFVEKAGAAPSSLPDVSNLDLCTDGKVIDKNAVSGQPDKAPFEKTQTDSSTEAGGYRAYNFSGQWSSYKTVYDAFKGSKADVQPVLAIGKTVSLQWTEAADARWSNTDATDEGRSIATKINVLESYSSGSWYSWTKVLGGGISKKGFNYQANADLNKFGTINVSGLIPTNMFSNWDKRKVNFIVDPNGCFWAQFSVFSDDRKSYNDRHQNQEEQQEQDILQRNLDNLPPLEQMKWSNLKQRARNDYNKMLANTNRDRYASGGGTWNWSYDFSVLLGGRWNLANGGAEGKIGCRFTANISGTAYTYLFSTPIYAGVELKGEAAAAAVLGVSFDGNGGADFEGVLEILFAATISVFVGFGAHGGMAFEASGSVGFFALANLFWPSRFRMYWGWNVRLQLNLYFIKVTYSIANKTYKFFDTMEDKLNNPTDQSPSIIGGYVPFPVAAGDESDSLNDTAPVEQETEDSASLAVVEAKDGDQEVTIASGGTEEVNKTSAITTTPAIDNNEKEQTVLENVTGSSSTAYVPGLFVRIANVKDEEHFDGNVVPRVTIAKTDASGITSDPIALSATKTSDEEGNDWYGYDYAFDVYEGEKYYFLVISSSNIMPKNHTIPELAEANRLRLILLDKETLEIKRESVLKKSEYKKDSKSQGRKDYFYTAPIITGDNLTEDKLTEEEKNLLKGKTGYLDQSGYYIASLIMTEPSNLTEMVQSETTQANVGMGLYVCRGGNYEISNPDAFQDYMYVGEAQPRQIAFANTDGRNPQLLFTEQSNLQMLHAIDLCTNEQYPFSLQCAECTDIVMSGDIYSLQQVENCEDGGKGKVFAVIGGVLNRLQLSFEDNKIVITPREIGGTTESGTIVIMPEADTLKLLYDEKTEALYGLVATTTSTGMDADGNMSQDTLIRVYPVSGIDTDQPVISGPFPYTIKNRQMFQLSAAIETGEKDTDWVLRVMYLADEKQEEISTYKEGTSAEEYIPGTVSSTCNLYMWELHGGRAAALTSMSAEDTVIRKSDGSFKMQLSLKNLGTERVNSVTFCVTDDKNRTDEAHYGTYTVTLPENGIGLGSTATIEQAVDIKSGWSGTTTLYAKIIQVNGKDLSEGFTPNWVEADSLLNNGAFSISVKEEGRGENPVARVTIENHSMVSFKNVALLVEKKKTNGNWYKAAEYNFSNLSDANATGADDKIMNVNVPLRTIWDDVDVIEARFTLVGQNDVTLNNAYTISETIRHENYSKYLMVYLQADAADDSMGEVTVDSSQSEAVAQVSESEEMTEESQQNSNVCYVPLNTEVSLSAKAKDGYVFDHWEIYGSEDWLRYSNEAEITVKAGARAELETAEGEKEIISEGARYTMRACFRVDDTKARITFVALEKVTTETEAEDGTTTTTISYRSSGSLPESVLTRDNGQTAEMVPGALGDETAYLLEAGEKIHLSAPEATSSRTEKVWTDDWSVVGFYNFSYEDSTYVINEETDALSPGDSSSGEYALSLEGGTDRYIAIVYEANPNPPKWVTIDYGDGQLDKNVPEAILRAGSNKIYSGEDLKDLLPLNSGQEQLTGRYGKLLGYYIRTSAGEEADEEGGTGESQENSSTATGQAADDISEEYVTLDALSSAGYAYEEIPSENAVIVAVYEPKGVIKLHANYGGWGDISFSTSGDVKVDETGTIIAPIGTKLTIKATPKKGYGFIKWRFLEPDSREYVDLDNSLSVEDVSTYEYTVGEEGQYDLLAVFSPTYQVNVIGGQVDQKYFRDGYVEGDEIFILANTAKAGYHFAGWFADGVKVESQDYITGFAMPANDVTLIALYEPDVHTITAGASGLGGTISPTGYVTMKDGEDCTFKIQANDGYVIDELTVDGEKIASAAGRSYDYELKSVTDDHDINVTFKKYGQEEENTYYLTVLNAEGEGKYAAGKHVHISAYEPAPKKRFAGWSIVSPENLSEEEIKNIFKFSLDEADTDLVMPAYKLSIKADYEEIFSIYAVAGEHGQIHCVSDYYGAVTVPAGGYETLSAAEEDTLRFSITPDAGYEISTLKVGGETVDAAEYASGTYTLSGVTKDSMLEVTFQKAEEKTVYYTINASASDGGSIKPSGTVNVQKGSNYSITATANDGYYLDSLTVNGNKIPITASTEDAQDVETDPVTTYTYELTSVDQDYTIHAEFAQQKATKYLLTVNDGKTTQCGETEAGKKVTLTAADAPEGKVFSGWTGLDDVEFADKTDKTCKTVSFIMPERDLTVTASYADEAIETFYTLTINDGSGKQSYTEAHKVGEVVKIQAAEPADGYIFAEWTGLSDVTFTEGTGITSAAASFEMPEKDLVVNVKYSRRSYQLTVENGTGTGTYLYGATVTIAADAAPENMKFAGWSGLDGVTLSDGCSLTDEKLSFTMPAGNLTAVGSYEEDKTETKEWSVHYTIANGGALTYGKTTLKGAGDIAVTEGNDCTLKVTPDEEYEISSIYIDRTKTDPAVLKDGVYTFSQVTGDHYITVFFTKKTVSYQITATATDGGTITPGGTSSVKEGNSLAFTATANEGYYLKSLIVDKGTGSEKDVLAVDVAQSEQTSTGGTGEQTTTYTYKFTKVSADHTIEAVFAQKESPAKTYSVTVTNGTGGGTYAAGAKVTLSANPAPEHQKFTGWSGLDGVTLSDGSSVTDEKVSFTMPTSNVTASAQYAVKTHTIKVTAPGTGKGGSVVPEGAPIEEGKVTIEEGQELRFIITPDSGYEIDSLKINGAAVDPSVLTEESGGSYSYTFRNVTDDSSSIEVTFKEKQISYTIEASASAGGIITPSGKNTVKKGENLSFTATANDGYYLKSLSVDGSIVPLKSSAAGNEDVQTGQNGQNSEEGEIYVQERHYTFENVTANRSIYAEFAVLPTPETYTLTLYNGSGAAEVRSYEYGDLVTITAAELADVDFAGWNGLEELDKDDFEDGTTSKDSTVSFRMPDYDLKVSAVYEQKKYTLTVTDGTGGGRYTAGSVVTISAKDYAGKNFDGWKGLTGVEFTDGTTSKDFTVSFKMPAEDVTARASYKEATKTCSITVTAPETGGTVSPSGNVTVATGGNVSFTITPDDGYIIDQLKIDGVEMDVPVESGSAYTFTMYRVTTNRNVEVSFIEEEKAYHSLTVSGGTGGGRYRVGKPVTIEANAAPAGQYFAGWQVSDGELDIKVGSLSSSSIVIAMPDHDVTLTATYKDVQIDPVKPDDGGSSSEAGAGESGSGSTDTAGSGAGNSGSSGSGVGNSAAGSSLDGNRTDVGTEGSSNGYWEVIDSNGTSGSAGMTSGGATSGNAVSQSGALASSGDAANDESEEAQGDLIHLRAVMVWDDEDDADGIRPTSVLFHLYADGEEIAMQKASAETNWVADFGKRSEMNGNFYISYAVTADGIGEEYSVTYQKSSIDDGELFTATAVHETEASKQAREEALQNSDTDVQATDSEDKQVEVDKRLFVYGTIAVLLMMVLLLIFLLAKRRKEEE